MVVKQAHISITRGDSFSFSVFLKKDDIEVGLMSGDKIYFTVKENVNTEEILIQKIITTFINGRALINVNPEDTDSLEYKSYKYDIQFTRADGLIKTIIIPSDFIIKPEVTYD